MNGDFNTRTPLMAAALPTVLPPLGAPAYFRKPANLRRWHSALAKVRAGLGRARVVFIGDSKTVGAGAGTTSANTWTTAAEPRSKIAYVAKLLNAAGIPASRQSFLASSTFSSPAIKQAYDLRLSGMSGWTGGSQTLGGVMWATLNTSPLTFTPEGQIDRIEAYFKLHAGDGQATLTVDADPTVLATLNGNAGGETIGKVVATPVRGTHAVNVQRTGGGYFSLMGLVAQDSTVPAVDLLNAGAFGTVSAYHTSAAGVWSAANTLAVVAPDLVVIQLGSNDLNTSVDVATYTANILDIVTKAKATGADVVLEVATFGNTGGYGTDAQREAYRQALIGLGALQGCMIIDHAARFVSYASANALGLMRDAIHETEPGYADEAQALVNALVF
ncbi:SGNH/GDSL hydrolase family protein [Bosea sp. ASV33]|uniref:SGNH/GDSL hydrolase family protein n=1 Tax=Bosea sp. ASV33 TaxID=2795106 RepID=UPI0018ECEA12|nr:SGNH/GDSL hydrolase family protein [Bosea sp. ASV33]